MVLKADYSHTKEVAQIHMKELKTGFLCSLGRPFLTNLYNSIIKKGILLVSSDDNRIDGFVSFSPNTRMLMIGFVFSNPLILLW